MKRNISFLTVVISLLLISSIVLNGCMYAIGTDKGDGKPYDINSRPSSGGGTVGGTLPAQAELQEKYGVYLHRDGKTVTVFSDKQYAELKAIRDSAKREPLSYDEILFLINDSISLYFTYDEIILTNAARDGLSLLFSQLSGDKVIHPSHADSYKGKNYTEAEQIYNKMIDEIYTIILYRIYMHDAGLEKVLPEPSSTLYLLSIDAAKVGGEENRQKLESEYAKLLQWNRLNTYYPTYSSSWFPVIPATYTSFAPDLYSPILSAGNGNTLEILGPEYGQTQQIYPTTELIDMRPRRNGYYQTPTAVGNTWPCLYLDFDTSTFGMSAHKVGSLDVFGRCVEHADVLKLYISNDDGDFEYVLNRGSFGYIYSAKDSHPMPGYEWPEYLSFEKVSEDADTMHSRLFLTVAETTAEHAAFEYRDEKPVCFYAYDNEGTLYRILKNTFDGLHEKDNILVEYRYITQLGDGEQSDGGYAAQYHIVAAYVTQAANAMASCLTAKNGSYTLTLPQSGGRITLYENENRFVPYIADELVTAAEAKLAGQIAEYGRHSDLYLRVEDDFLCLAAYVTLQSDGDDNYIFYSERISSHPIAHDRSTEFVADDEEYKKIWFYPQPMDENKAKTFDAKNCDWDRLSDDDMDVLRRIYNGGKGWVDDSMVDRMPFCFDGQIRYADADSNGRMYFGFDQNVLYYNGRFNEIAPEVLCIIEKARKNIEISYRDLQDDVSFTPLQ